MNLVAAPDCRRICAWCQTVLREGPEPTSHSMCQDCAKKWSPK